MKKKLPMEELIEKLHQQRNNYSGWDMPLFWANQLLKKERKLFNEWKKKKKCVPRNIQ